MDRVLVEIYRFDILLVVIGVIEATMCRVASSYEFIRIFAFSSVIGHGIRARIGMFFLAMSHHMSESGEWQADLLLHSGSLVCLKLVQW